jgi:arylsulfatase A-like enzyme
MIDGIDQTPLLLGQRKQGRDDFLYFCQGELHAVRKGNWKAVLPNRKKFYGYVKDKGSEQVELYNLDSDIGEKTNLAKEQPQIVEDLLRHAKSISLPDEPYNSQIRLRTNPPPKNAKTSVSAPG